MHLLALFISVFLELQADGSAVVTETWDIDSDRGTELYIVRNNLGDIEISGLQVSENGENFINEGSWDINRSLEEKKGRCGISGNRNGCELCWGLGSYGHHTFTVKYNMSNVIKSLNDFDMLHMQLVSPGISPTPSEVSVKIKAPAALSEDNCAIWGFGYRGNVNFTQESDILLSSEGFDFEGCSIIALIRFNKGIFNSTSVQDRNFDTVLEQAMEGTDYDWAGDEGEDDAKNALGAFLGMISCLTVSTAIALIEKKKRIRNILGCGIKEIGWSRDIPFDGDILQSNMTLDALGQNKKSNAAGAMILQMINSGHILNSVDSKGNIVLSFNQAASPDTLDEAQRGLYDMMKEASGADVILQKNEFRRWSRRHAGRVSKWAENLDSLGREKAREKGNMQGRSFTASGRDNARKLLGFRNYLNDYTLLEQRGSREVSLWRDYLVYATLYGIAEKVAEELREINPEEFERQFVCDYNTMYQTIYLTQTLANSITNARALTQSANMARAGRGGISSFGGGGGFSGGGFGGGVR